VDFIFKIVFSETLSESESCLTVWADIFNSLADMGNITILANLYRIKKIFTIANDSHDLDNGIPNGLDHIV
jgi:hypothetical protein